MKTYISLTTIFDDDDGRWWLKRRVDDEGWVGKQAKASKSKRGNMGMGNSFLQLPFRIRSAATRLEISNLTRINNMRFRRKKKVSEGDIFMFCCCSCGTEKHPRTQMATECRTFLYGWYWEKLKSVDIKQRAPNELPTLAC